MQRHDLEELSELNSVEHLPSMPQSLRKDKGFMYANSMRSIKMAGQLYGPETPDQVLSLCVH